MKAVRLIGGDDGILSITPVAGNRDERRVWHFAEAAAAMAYVKTVFQGTNEPLTPGARPDIHVREAQGGVITSKRGTLDQFWAMPAQLAALEAWLVAQFAP